MKTRFLKYCLSIAALLFVAFSCFPNNAQSLQFGKGNTQTDLSYLHPDKTFSSHFALKKGHDKGFHKETIHHTLINHLKANFHETEFEAETVVKLKKAKALFKFQVLSFACILSGKGFNEQVVVPFEYSRLNSFLHSALYLRLQVMRL